MEIRDPGTFRTSNEDIAIGLLTAGCQWAKPEDGGPAQTHYTPDLLRDRKHITGGIDPEKFESLSASLFLREIPGATSFFLRRSHYLDQFIDAWAKAHTEFRQAEIDGRDPITEDVPAATIARVIYAFCRNRKDNKKAPFLRPPKFSYRREVNVRDGERDGKPTVITSGSMKSWWLGIPEEKRSHIGIHPTPPELRRFQSSTSPASK